MSAAAVLSLGSNLGDRLDFLAQGVRVLGPRAVSPVYETVPVGPVVQPTFLNIVVLVDADAATVWSRAVRAERVAGRLRNVPAGPRTLDVDVITAAGVVPGLVLPHPRAHERAFVLVPWLDVDPEAILPGHGPVAALVPGLLAGREPPPVRRRDDLAVT